MWMGTVNSCCSIMMQFHENTFCITGSLWGESPRWRWSPHRDLLCGASAFSMLLPWTRWCINILIVCSYMILYDKYCDCIVAWCHPLKQKGHFYHTFAIDCKRTPFLLSYPNDTNGYIPFMSQYTPSIIHKVSYVSLWDGIVRFFPYLSGWSHYRIRLP